MNSRINHTPLKGIPKKKGFKGTHKSNKKDNEIIKQTVKKKTNYKIQTPFLLLKKLFHSDHYESANFHFGFKNQGTNICCFNSVI